MEMNLSQDQIQKYTDCLQLYVNSTVKELRRLFLVQDLVDSLKVRLLQIFLTLLEDQFTFQSAVSHVDTVLTKLSFV